MAKNTSKRPKHIYRQHRARKAPKCITCKRTLRRASKRHPQSNMKRRQKWDNVALPCQFCPKEE